MLRCEKQYTRCRILGDCEKGIKTDERKFALGEYFPILCENTIYSSSLGSIVVGKDIVTGTSLYSMTRDERLITHSLYDAMENGFAKKGQLIILFERPMTRGEVIQFLSKMSKEDMTAYQEKVKSLKEKYSQARHQVKTDIKNKKKKNRIKDRQLRQEKRRVKELKK